MSTIPRRSSAKPLTVSAPMQTPPFRRARTLVAGGRYGIWHARVDLLAIHMRVNVRLADGEPVCLISRAEHTRNLSHDPRASLLVNELGNADPLANGRVTLLGRCEKLTRPASRARDAFLALHPGASYYVDYDDFDFWQLRVEAVRYIGGYGDVVGCWTTTAGEPTRSRRRGGDRQHMTKIIPPPSSLRARFTSRMTPSAPR